MNERPDDYNERLARIERILAADVAVDAEILKATSYSHNWAEGATMTSHHEYGFGGVQVKVSARCGKDIGFWVQSLRGTVQLIEREISQLARHLADYEKEEEERKEREKVKDSGSAI